MVRDVKEVRENRGGCGLWLWCWMGVNLVSKVSSIFLTVNRSELAQMELPSPLHIGSMSKIDKDICGVCLNKSWNLVEGMNVGEHVWK